MRSILRNRFCSWVPVVAALFFVTSSLPQLLQAQTNVTVRGNIQRSIGGISELDRAKYFNHHGTLQAPGISNLGNLRQEAWSSSGLNTVTGRTSTELDQFISQNLPEDPTKPGFFEHAALISKIQGDYRNFVLNGSRWEGLRNHPNAIFVQSGRNGGFWPNFLDGGGLMPSNFEAYADFLNVYLEEAVYGTGPNQGFLPLQKDRFYLEVMNEPNWSTPTQSQWDGVIEMHRVVTELVKEQFPQAKIGGPSCCDDLNPGQNSWERSRQLMDDMVNWETPSGQSVELDFWTIHPYERYNVANDGSWSRQVTGSPGHSAAIMDLYESYSHQLFGEPKAFAITEYGSFNQANSSGSYGNYTRTEQQWDLVRDIKEKMLVYMDRPDRIINATPFVSPRHWQNAVPTNPSGDNVFWEQVAGGAWQETVVAGMFRMFADVRGEYVPVGSDNTDLQAMAFRDGNEIHVLLNNLEKVSNTINLQALISTANVTSASLDRVFWNGTQGIYESDLDVSGTWQNLTLDGEEGAVLKLTLSGPQLYDLSTNENTYYGDVVTTPIGAQGKSQVVNIAAETENAVSAQVRVGFNRDIPGKSPGESFFVFVNNVPIQVPAGELNFDDGDVDMVSRTVNVPLSALVDGNNEVYVDFVGDGGELVSAVLIVTESIGDFDGSGVFDGGDVSALVAQYGPAPAGSEYDLNGDGMIDSSDLQVWLTDLRGKTESLAGDFDLNDVVDGEDLALWEDGYTNGGDDFGDGDLNFDGVVAGIDFLGWQVAATLPSSVAATPAVPEPTGMVLGLFGLSLLSSRSGIRQNS